MISAITSDMRSEFLDGTSEYSATLEFSFLYYTVVLGKSDIKSVSWRSKACEGQFTYGSAIAGELEVSFLTEYYYRDGIIEDGKELKLYAAKEDGGEYESSKKLIGIYYVDGSETSENGLFTTVKAYDVMCGSAMARRCPVANTLPSSTIGAAVSAVSSGSGVTTANPPNWFEVVDGTQRSIVSYTQEMLVGPEKNTSSQSYRDVVSRIATASGCCARATAKSTGVPWIRFFRPYTGTASSSIVSIEQKHVKAGGFLWDGVSGSHIGRYMTRTTSSSGATSAYYYSTSTVDTGSTYMEIPSDTFANVNYFSKWCKRVDLLDLDYRGFSLSCVGVPFVEPFDKVVYKDKNGELHDLWPFSVTHTFNGAWSTSMEAQPLDATFPNTDDGASVSDETSASSEYGKVIGSQNLLTDTARMHSNANVMAASNATGDTDEQKLNKTIRRAIMSISEDGTEFGDLPPFGSTIDRPGEVAVFVSGSTSCLSAEQVSPYNVIRSTGATKVSGSMRPLYFENSGTYGSGDIVVVTMAAKLEPFSDGSPKTYTFSHYWNKGTTNPGSSISSQTEVKARWRMYFGSINAEADGVAIYEVDPINVSSVERSQSQYVVNAGEYLRDSYTFTFPESFYKENGAGYPVAIILVAEWNSDYDTLSTGAWKLEEGSCCSTYSVDDYDPHGMWATAYGMSEAYTMTNALSSLSLASITGSSRHGFSLNSLGGIKCPIKGTVLIVGVIQLGTGFTANDLVHVRVSINGTTTGPDIVERKVSSSYGTLQITTIANVAKDAVVYLKTYNQTAARGTVQATTSTRLTVAYL